MTMEVVICHAVLFKVCSAVYLFCVSAVSAKFNLRPHETIFYMLLFSSTVQKDIMMVIAC